MEVHRWRDLQKTGYFPAASNWQFWFCPQAAGRLQVHCIDSVDLINQRKFAGKKDKFPFFQLSYKEKERSSKVHEYRGLNIQSLKAQKPKSKDKELHFYFFNRTIFQLMPCFLRGLTHDFRGWKYYYSHQRVWLNGQFIIRHLVSFCNWIPTTCQMFHF